MSPVGLIAVAVQFSTSNDQLGGYESSRNFNVSTRNTCALIQTLNETSMSAALQYVR